MCGIYFKLCKEIDLSEFQNFTRLKHRGPDRSIFQCIQNKQYSLIYGFHRLRIVGNIKHDQPFVQNDVSVLCNGEIYNYKSLISTHHLLPKTDSDCEVILLLYKKYGIQRMLELIDGEFAFIIHDMRDNTVYCARDLFGVRPLFTNTCKNSSIVLTSEAKAQNECEQVVPGMYYQYKISTHDGLNIQLIKHNYHVYPKIGSVFSKSQMVNYIELAIYKRVIGCDQQTGFLLSGGLDSSLVLSIAMKYLSEDHYPIPVFSIGYKGESKDKELSTPDVNRAKQVVSFLKKKYGNHSIDHHIVCYNKNMATKVLDKVIYMLESSDITTIRASTPMYILAQYISKMTQVKVVISGEGSDELFGGYLYFRYAPSMYEFYNEKLKLLQQIHLFDGLRADRMISAHGLELRVPFLDRDLANHVLSLPLEIASEKYSQIEKYLLRNAFDESTLPHSILWTQKEAFSDGVGHSWIHDLKSIIEKTTSITLVNWKLITDCELTVNSEYYCQIDEKYLNFDMRKELLLNYIYCKEPAILCLQGLDQLTLDIVQDLNYECNYVKIKNGSYVATMTKNKTSLFTKYLYSVSLSFGLISLFLNEDMSIVTIVANVDMYDPEKNYSELVENIQEIQTMSNEITYKLIVSGEIYSCNSFQQCLETSVITNHRLNRHTSNVLLDGLRMKNIKVSLSDQKEYPNNECPSVNCPIILDICTTTEKEYYQTICKKNYSLSLVPYLWLPNWICTNEEPSATVLPTYDSSKA